MINLAILVVVCALAYHFRGGGIMPCPDGLRKPIYCIVTGAVFGLLAWDLWAGIIVGVCSLLPPLTSPRPFFNSWRGANATDDTTVNWLNAHQHWVARKITNLIKGKQ